MDAGDLVMHEGSSLPDAAQAKTIDEGAKRAGDGPGEDRNAARAPDTQAGVAAWGLVMFTGCRLIEIFLEAQSMAAAVGQAVLVEWGATRLGIPWSPRATETGAPVTTPVIARRIAFGAAVGIGTAAALIGLLVVSGGARIEGVSNVEGSVLIVGLATAALGAWRDELLFHGVTLRALEGSIPAGVGCAAKVLACGLTSAGAALGRADATVRSVLSAALLGLLFGFLWVRDRGAWRPWAAHASLRFTLGTLLSGGVVHARLAEDTWAGGSAGALGGSAATLALAPLAALALGWAARRISPTSAPIG